MTSRWETTTCCCTMTTVPIRGHRRCLGPTTVDERSARSDHEHMEESSTSLTFGQPYDSRTARAHVGSDDPCHRRLTRCQEPSFPRSKLRNPVDEHDFCAHSSAAQSMWRVARPCRHARRSELELTDVHTANVWITIPRDKTASSRQSRANIARASRARSTNGSPLTSTIALTIVPPVKAHGLPPL